AAASIAMKRARVRRISEPQTQSCLQTAHRVRRCRRAELQWAVDGGVPGAECYVVDRVRGIDAKVESVFVAHPKRTRQGSIKTELRRTSDRIPGRIAPVSDRFNI